jgi:hypothetical protein
VIALLAGVAVGQSCSCSIGTSDATLPTGMVAPAGAVAVGVDYGVGQTGGEPWEGVVPADDRLGNSMPDMAMPGHLAQSFRATGAVGAPKGFGASVAVPFVYSEPLYASDMPGDVPRAFLGDISLLGRWGHRHEGTFVGAALGATLPTGKVVRGVGVRGGRGAVGTVVDLSALQMVSPVIGLAGRVGSTFGLYPSPIDTYWIAPQLDAILGARIWTHEQGKVSFTGLTSAVHRGHDRRGEDVLEETGSDVLSVGTGADWRAWSERDASMTLSARALVPVFQVVGDPWLAENWSVAIGTTFGF